MDTCTNLKLYIDIDSLFHLVTHLAMVPMIVLKAEPAMLQARCSAHTQCITFWLGNFCFVFCCSSFIFNE